MQTAQIVIVGGGLSGLYAAYLLLQRGFRDYVLLEAREVLGGRIVSVPAPAPGSMPGSAAEVANRFDLGPSWFRPGYQRQLDRLVDELGLTRFEQFEDGDMMAERSPHAAPARMRGYASAPPSMRLMGGMAALTNALHRSLDSARIFTGHTVRVLRAATEAQVEVESVDASGRLTTWRAAHVLLALPPRLVEARIAFLPAGFTGGAVAPMARHTNLDGTACQVSCRVRHAVLVRAGPLGRGPKHLRTAWRDPRCVDSRWQRCAVRVFRRAGDRAQGVTEAELKALCRAQLVRLFGPQAATPRLDLIQDWALEPNTATAADLDSAGQYVEAPPSMAASAPWCGRLTGIASEWSPQFPGYVAGAVEAASLALQRLAEGGLPDGRPLHLHAPH